MCQQRCQSSTVFDLIDEPHRGLHLTGRLDLDTTGLLLITGDGAWSHRIRSPRYQIIKTYRVDTEEPVTHSMIQQLERGIFLRPENLRTKPAQVDLLSERQILLHIHEGKYHQVKRMLHAVTNSVGEASSRVHRRYSA